MTGCKRSPKRAFRLQAGVKPLQRIAINSSPEGAIVSSATPLGLGLQSLVYRGFTPVWNHGDRNFYTLFKITRFSLTTFSLKYFAQ